MPIRRDILRVRNIGIIAHIDAGKTTTTERMLYYAGFLHRMGEVHDGNTFMDWMEQEKERGITITSAVTKFEWQDRQINIIDTPGHVDFTAEVQRSLRVLDGAVGVFDAVKGVEPQSETVWHQADRFGISRLAFINKMDRVAADFNFAVETIRSKLTNNAMPIQIPIGSANCFEGIVDLVSMKAYYFKQETQGFDFYSTEEMPEDLRNEALENRDALLEHLSEFDDIIIEKYLEGDEITEDELKNAIKKAVISNKLIPVLCGSSLKNTGIQLLLNAVVDYLPSPLEVKPIIARLKSDQSEVKVFPDDDAPFSALAFKVRIDKYVGKMIYIRVYSGTIKKGDVVIDQTNGKRQRILRIMHVFSNKTTDIEQISSGEIAAIIGPKEVYTGDTLTSANNDLLLSKIYFPDGVISRAIEAKSKPDQEALESALQKMEEEDPTFRIMKDKETGQTLMTGMGELHLDIIIDRLNREYNVVPNVGNPQVSYKETITKEVMATGEFIREINGKGQYAVVNIKLSPMNADQYYAGEKVLFVNNCNSSVIPKEYWGAIEESAIAAVVDGYLMSAPVEKIVIELVGGAYHEIDSNETAFKIATSIAIRQALGEAEPVLMEPVMKVSVITPEEFVGDVISDANSKRGRIDSISDRKNNKEVVADIPMSELFGYANRIRSVSQGRAYYTMEFHRYENVPSTIQSNLMKKLRGY
ncbi:MAG: elongation factor G [Candidatus Cloacimonetes bacterium]|nr:elongation factor G [Candidatus Cloacimonadota bacterium]